MNSVTRELMRPSEPRQAQAAAPEQAARAQEPPARDASASQVAQPSAVVTLSAAARGEGVAQPPAQGGSEARAVEQARAAAANGDVRSNYSAQRALASYEAMSQVGANNASARPSQPEQPTAPGQREPGVLRT
jgi:S-DNA-T family DNA segregation ATPase FtsK/SpoIIIE